MTAISLTSTNASWCFPHTVSKVLACDLLLNVKVVHASMHMLVFPVFVKTVHSSGLARRYIKEEKLLNICNVKKTYEILPGVFKSRALIITTHELKIGTTVVRHQNTCVVVLQMLVKELV